MKNRVKIGEFLIAHGYYFPEFTQCLLYNGYVVECESIRDNYEDKIIVKVYAREGDELCMDF